MSELLMTVPLSKLQRSASNVRTIESEADIEDLAANISALGILQNLIVKPVSLPNGEPNGKYEVIAGGQRLAALTLLAKRRRIGKNFPVPCRLLADNDETEVSLAENVFRAPLHPADQFDAFSKLQAKGQGIEDIAARFGVTPNIVQQRLKLAAVSPRLMEVYRAGDMSLDQLSAFTLTDDHEAQDRVWFDGPMFDRQPSTIRRLLTKTLVEGGDRRAKYVGATTYEAAGGTIVRDLFRSDDEGYFVDSQLLDRLVAGKLAQDAESVKAEGWTWVEVLPEMDYGYLAKFRRLSPSEVILSDEEEARIESLSNRYDELVLELEEEATDGQEDELNRVSAELDALIQKKVIWTDEQKSGAGAVVVLDYHGTANVTRGLVKEEPAGAEPDRLSPSGMDGDTGKATKRAENGLPDKLIENLSAHRTAVLREEIAVRADVALTALLHTLALRIFYGYLGETCVEIHPRLVDLRPSAEGIGESRAVALMAGWHQEWREQMPDMDGLWSWLVTLDDEMRSGLLAYCVGVSVNALVKRHDPGSRERMDQADMLAAAVALDMADWWEPTKGSYFSFVSKAHIHAAVADAVSKPAADNIATMKKEPMARRAEELLAGRRWLPEPLRPPAPRPAEAREVASATEI